MLSAREHFPLDELEPLDNSGERQEYFAEHPRLSEPSLVWRLSQEARNALWSDLPKAKRLSDTACWLAQELQDDSARARSLRARAGVLCFGHQYPQAVEIYEESIELFRLCVDEHEVAITESSAIEALGQTGQFSRALEFSEAAQAVLQRNNDHLHLGRTEVSLGLIFKRLDRYPEALKHYQQALDHFQDEGRPEDLATTLLSIGVCLQNLSDLEGCRETYEQARLICTEHGLEQLGLEVEYNVAYLYYLSGEYGKAIHFLEISRQHCEERGNHRLRALCELDLSEIYLELNMARDAAHLADQAEMTFKELSMEYEQGKALASRAIAAKLGGQVTEALELLEEAQKIFRRIDNRVWVAMVQLHKALILFTGGRLEAADDLAETAHETFRRSRVESRTVACEVLRARVALDRKRPDLAKEWCDSALQRLQRFARPALEFQVHYIAGRAAEASGDLSAALGEFRLAEEALEQLRAHLATDELKVAFGDDKHAVYEALVDTTLRCHDRDAKTAAAFEYVEKSKARGLSDMLAAAGSTGLPVAEDEGGALVEEHLVLGEEVNWCYRQIEAEELKGSSRSVEHLAMLRDHSRQLEASLLRNRRRLTVRRPEFSTLRGFSVADVDAIRSSLGESTVLIEYFMSRGKIQAFVLDQNRLTLSELGATTEVEALDKFLEFQLAKLKYGPTGLPGNKQRRDEDPPAGLTTGLRRLHEKLIEPLELGDVEHLVIVPHAFLHHIPFHALQGKDGFVIDRHSVSYAPSATVHHLCERRPSGSDHGALVVGVPDEKAPRILDEARAVAELLPESRLLMGAEATRADLQAHAESVRFLHIATHGLHRKDNPMFSALQLGDARLSLLDLYDFRLNAELVVVSGCGTGLGTVRGTDEFVGLTRGLLHAGARCVLATLWDVNDESAAEFMGHFYDQLVDGHSPARASRAAIGSLREHYPNPYHWAPFVLTGRAQRPIGAAPRSR